MGMRERLKSSTEAQHRALDALIEARGFFRTIDGYRRWLAGAHAFHRLVNEALLGVEIAQVVPADLLCTRVRLLERDLDDLAWRPIEVGAFPVQRAADHVDALGVLYVSEGSALGARVLLQRAVRLGMSDAFGARLLASQAVDFRTWHAVMAALEAASPADPGDARMIAAGCHAFDLATHCFGTVA